MLPALCAKRVAGRDIALRFEQLRSVVRRHTLNLNFCEQFLEVMGKQRLCKHYCHPRGPVRSRCPLGGCRNPRSEELKARCTGQFARKVRLVSLLHIIGSSLSYTTGCVRIKRDKYIWWAIEITKTNLHQADQGLPNSVSSVKEQTSKQTRRKAGRTPTQKSREHLVKQS